MIGTTCPFCGSTKVEEDNIRIPLEILKVLYTWSEYKCLDCGTLFIIGKLVIVKGIKQP